MSIFLFIIILAGLILVHEFGHFIVAKRAGIRVDEFGIGFPPRLWGRTRGETTYSVNLIPFGGFVKIFGENPGGDPGGETDKTRSFAYRPRITQAAVVGAGIAFNALFAWLLVTIAFISGMPAPSDAFSPDLMSETRVVITDVRDGSPAKRAGLMSGDVLQGIVAGERSITILSPEDVQDFVAREGSRDITLRFKRGKDELTAPVTPISGIVPDRLAIGIAMDTVGIVRLPLGRAAIEAGKTVFETAGAIAVGFATLVGQALQGTAHFSDVTGPIGIVGLVGDAASFGIIYLIGFTAFISVNLAVINLIPFPALDGGRLFFIAIEAIKRHPLNPALVNTLNTAGFIALILLLIVITYGDIAALL